MFVGRSFDFILQFLEKVAGIFALRGFAYCSESFQIFLHFNSRTKKVLTATISIAV